MKTAISLQLFFGHRMNEKKSECGHTVNCPWLVGTLQVAANVGEKT
jgi:hypothetical protein